MAYREGARAPGTDFSGEDGKILRADLERTDVPFKVAGGVVDFHTLRLSDITHLIESRASPKTIQELARHSTITLTIVRYTKTNDRRKREAPEGVKPPDARR